MNHEPGAWGTRLAGMLDVLQNNSGEKDHEPASNSSRKVRESSSSRTDWGMGGICRRRGPPKESCYPRQRWEEPVRGRGKLAPLRCVLLRFCQTGPRGVGNHGEGVSRSPWEGEMRSSK